MRKNSRTVLVTGAVGFIGSHVSEALVARGETVIEPLSEQPGDVPRTYASVEKARELLGWEPHWTLAKGLRRFVDWYQRRNERGTPEHCACDSYCTSIRADLGP